MENELEILKRLHRQTFAENELVEMFHQYNGKYRVLFHLVQQPQFPGRLALSVIPRLFPMDLLRVIKNKMTNPYIRRRAETEFVAKYPRFPLGEKITYMKIAPNSLLKYFTEENNIKILEIILSNPNCSEEVVLMMINRSSDRFSLYGILPETEWVKHPQVALGISHDLQAPIKLLVTIIPFLPIHQLEKLYMDENTHQVVKNNIILYLKKREPVNHK